MYLTGETIDRRKEIIDSFPNSIYVTMDGLIRSCDSMDGRVSARKDEVERCNMNLIR